MHSCIGIWIVLRHVYILEAKSKARLWGAIAEDFGKHTLANSTQGLLQTLRW